MMRPAKALYHLLWLAPCLLYGCVLSQVTEARLYDFNSGMLSTARFYDLDEQHGRIKATLYNGEELRGEFTLTNEHQSAASLPRLAQIDFDQPPPATQGTKGDDTTAHPSPKTLATVFGFPPDGDARPLGIATLVGERGFVLQIVIYDLDLDRGVGNGVGKDNKGNWYLVRIGS
jgi:hypothetical protein